MREWRRKDNYYVAASMRLLTRFWLAETFFRSDTLADLPIAARSRLFHSSTFERWRSVQFIAFSTQLPRRDERNLLEFEEVRVPIDVGAMFFDL